MLGQGRHMAGAVVATVVAIAAAAAYGALVGFLKARTGAHEVIVLGPKPGDAFREQVKALTSGRGADVIFDPVGGDLPDTGHAGRQSGAETPDQGAGLWACRPGGGRGRVQPGLPQFQLL